ncbi:family 78 glycoside hydrolase catalytic domain [Paenibacillus tritici]|uniref:alpha-L-rhamnosidase n=1 Tax=Paenibacillus tritici TaxID=1873425 RepID=A0ABX2DKG2_9BACL|nr:glycoside hydrolase family 78 protein [Paenibacillus tritici]NQX45082.1 family 78 glycoside hydrolase catalytic domain [Paenibacillus tritici]QUL53124.1 glycoside hydrolase family 78 protein [Paenibacillus tritici]
MIAVQKLRVEYRENPLGLDIRYPRISWQMRADERDVRQQAYQIQIAGEQDFGSSLLWDSGRVESGESLHLELKELELQSRQRYYYRITLWDQQNRQTGWSETAWWEMGLLSPEEWEAEWITAPLACLDVHADQVPLLRGNFRVDRQVTKARIYVTSLGLYELELNGARVGDAVLTPGWTSYRERLQFQTYDMTGQLAVGNNVLGAWLGNGWYKGNLGWNQQKHLYGDRTALLLQLHLTYEDGGEQIIGTGPQWKVSPGPILMSELYHGETYDARLEQRGFSQPEYDDKGWVPAEILPYTKQILLAQENVPVRAVQELTPVALIHTPAGETVLDLGQNMVGWLRFTVEGEPGQEYQLRHFEVLDQEGNVYTENLRTARQTVTYIAAGGGQESYQPRFTFQGFRYVQLIGFPAQPELQNFTGVVLHSDMEPTGTFTCSDPLLNQLQHNILWGQKGNFVDVPTDCPQRDERLGWTGDAQMFIRTSAYLMNVAPFFSKWLKDLSADQQEDGGVPYVIPHVLGEKEYSSAAWGDAAVICPWTIYQCYGDKRILEQQYSSMQGWVEYIRRQGTDEFLWNTGVHFGDWLGLDAKPDSHVGATDSNYIATAFYAYSVQLMEKTAKVLGRTEDAQHYSLLHSGVKAAFNQAFIIPAGEGGAATQTACVLALMFGLVEGTAKEHTVARLIGLLEESGYHLTTGFVGTPYLNLVLADAGHMEAAYKLLLQTDYPSWLYQITRGATTIWEHWDGIKEDGSFWSKNMNSFNHYAYGAIGDFLYRYVAGIEQMEDYPGYKQFLIQPHPGGGLTSAAAGLESMYGKIRSEWTIASGRIELIAVVPPNTSATVYLPDAALPGVLESGQQLQQVRGIHSAEQLAQAVKLTLGSGEYRFEYTFQK